MTGCLAASGRVTPREVLRAYEETGLRPIFGGWYIEYPTNQPSACALTAVAKQSGWDDPERLHHGYAASIMLEKRMSPDSAAWDYRDGFAKGFDGTMQRRDWPYERAEWMGYRDGQRARAFVKDRYPEDG